jgi:hypothetical protein
MSNIHGFCPSCKADLDGDLVINYPLSQGKSMEEAVAYAAMYAGWNEHGEANRWGRAKALYCFERDRTTGYRCPDCDAEWELE